ncbi:potassium channel family protein [Cribrihabitans neustonicus]|uniref:potassium channel family protein n=1 Tax=Cribrihabitans neustonicus TaxID=1429085 RepID=UPI003B5B9C94
MGSIYLGVCLFLEIAVLVWCAALLAELSKRFPAPHGRRHNAAILMIAIGLIVLAHTAQVWIWASAFMMVGAIGEWNTALYFSLSTYTTLGYGDVVLGPGLRIFAAFAAVTGMLAFGVSTAFLVSVMGRMFSLNGGAPGERS